MTGRHKVSGLSGAAMSRKQLARTVLDGKQVTFHLAAVAEPVSGYLCGMDDYHWLVISSDGTKALVHKAGASLIRLSDQSTYDAEPNRDRLEDVVGPFRRFVAAELFGQRDRESIPEARSNTGQSNMRRVV